MTSKTPIPPAPTAPKHATLIEALIAAQSDFPTIPKEATGQARGGKYQYATLPAVLEAVVPWLNHHGIALIQRTAIEGESMTLHTILRHTSGDEVESVVPLPAPQNWQEWGSAMTYARRYSITALAGVAPDDDDDAATAQGAPKVEAPHGICPDHDVPYFQSPKMRSPAHKLDSGRWCDKPELGAGESLDGRAAAEAMATVQPPAPPLAQQVAAVAAARQAAPTNGPMPQSVAMAPHGVCPEHRAVLVPIGQKVGHWRTVDGKRTPCFIAPATALDQADDGGWGDSLLRHPGEGYTDLGPGGTTKAKEEAK